MTLITYKLTQENYQPQVGDEADVWYEGDSRFVEIKEIRDDGAILVYYEDDTDLRWIRYPNLEYFYDAIGDV